MIVKKAEKLVKQKERKVEQIKIVIGDVDDNEEIVDANCKNTKKEKFIVKKVKVKKKLLLNQNLK